MRGTAHKNGQSCEILQIGLVNNHDVMTLFIRLMNPHPLCAHCIRKLSLSLWAFCWVSYNFTMSSGGAGETISLMTLNVHLHFIFSIYPKAQQHANTLLNTSILTARENVNKNGEIYKCLSLPWANEQNDNRKSCFDTCRLVCLTINHSINTAGLKLLIFKWFYYKLLMFWLSRALLFLKHDSTQRK